MPGQAIGPDVPQVDLRVGAGHDESSAVGREGEVNHPPPGRDVGEEGPVRGDVDESDASPVRAVPSRKTAMVRPSGENATTLNRAGRQGSSPVDGSGDAVRLLAQLLGLARAETDKRAL